VSVTGSPVSEISELKDERHMNDPLALAVSAFALSISAVTAWLTLFQRGTVRMTQPTVI
jgi:hypothetical protein